jgi:hypothetical protein
MCIALLTNLVRSKLAPRQELASLNRPKLRPRLRVLCVPLKNRLQMRFRVILAADGCEAFGVGQFDLVAFRLYCFSPLRRRSTVTCAVPPGSNPTSCGGGFSVPGSGKYPEQNT